MKRLFLLAATAAMFAACSQNEELSALDNKDATPETVDFSVYLNATRAGTNGAIYDGTDPGCQYKTKLSEPNVGFGVYAYYSDNDKYSEYLRPNFMYNQWVKKDGDTWTYEPAKYWPNEFGTDAASEDVDYLSFFAYAPYVKFVPSSGAVDVSDAGTLAEALTDDDKARLGLTGLTGQELTDAYIEFLQKKNIIGTIRNTSTGDPMIKYAVDWNPKTSVDLLWGVSNKDYDYKPITSGPSVKIAKGMPFVDMLKLKNNEKISYNFRHALAWLNVQIDADFNAEGVDGSHGETVDFTDGKTKIWIRSITFDGFASKGALNLKNDKANLPKWMASNGTDELETGSVTIYDGRKDGGEGVLSNEATGEQPQTLNPQLIQSEPYALTSGATDYTTALTTTNNISGVTKSPQNLFTGTTVDDQIYVIPTSEQVNVTIVYDVETKDDNLATYLSDGQYRGSSIQNRITKKNVFNAALVAGKTYKLKLHLGMTDVKFEATVEPWANGGQANPYLPANY